MCAKYETPDSRALERIWEIKRSNGMEEIVKRTAFPGLMGVMATLHDDEPIWAAGQFGLLPHWVKPDAAKKHARFTYNARSETVHEKASYKTAWKHLNLCVIPAQAIFEPNYETGKPESWRIERVDGEPILIAGIHWSWKNIESGEYLETFSMLTVNADDHAVMKRFHKPEEEKRSVAMLDKQDKEAWLRVGSHDEARAFLRPYAAEELTASNAA
jgi:putative SOS response-associated peptidase YedK